MQLSTIDLLASYRSSILSPGAVTQSLKHLNPVHYSEIIELFVRYVHLLVFGS